MRQILTAHLESRTMPMCKLESEPSTQNLTHASSELGAQAENLTHALRSGQHVSTNYQRSRLNVFIAPTHRQQIDVLSAEWNCPLVEAVRRLLTLGLSQIMQADLSE